MQKFGATCTSEEFSLTDFWLHTHNDVKNGFYDVFRVPRIRRGAWAEALGVRRETLWRWEDAIIVNPVPFRNRINCKSEVNRALCLFYFETVDEEKIEAMRRARSQKYYLDGYQRFFLAQIQALKSGRINDVKMTNQQIIDWFFEKLPDGKMRLFQFSRAKFKNWIGE